MTIDEWKKEIDTGYWVIGEAGSQNGMTIVDLLLTIDKRDEDRTHASGFLNSPIVI